MDLFELREATNMKSESSTGGPECVPESLIEGRGTGALLFSKDKLLYRAIKADKIKLYYLLWIARNREDDLGEGHWQILQVQNFHRSMLQWPFKKDMEEVVVRRQRTLHGYVWQAYHTLY